MLEDFAASLIQEDGASKGENAFDGLNTVATETQVETPASSPTEKQTNEGAPSPEGAAATTANTQDDNNIPFHKHPRWIEREKELKELREFRSNYAPKIDQLTEVIARSQEQATAKETPPIPKWFKGMYGEDQEAWSDYLQNQEGLRAQIKAEIIQDQIAKAQQEQAEKAKWSEWVENSIQSLVDEGEKFEVAELQRIALEYLPTDMEGNIDFRKALSIYKELQRVKETTQAVQSTARKQIGDMTTGKSKAEKPISQFQTPSSLRNKTFNQLTEESN